MLDEVFDNLRKATESSIQLQQELFQKWAGLFPAGPSPAAATTAAAWDGMSKARDTWEALTTELLQRQRQMVDEHYAAGLKSLEDVFRVGHARSQQEVQERVVELYRKSFDSLRQLSESQMKEFKTMVDRWAELVSKAG
jgi:hypothetical protein